MKHANPPSNCDACERPIMLVFYDAATPRGWGNFCPMCFIKLGCKLGTGRGQRFERPATGGPFEKTSG